MNIIELVKDIINSYDGISRFTNGVHVDFTESEPVNYGLSSTGDETYKKNILGDEWHRHNFQLYAVHQAFTDYDRLSNSNFMLEFGYWLAEVLDDRDIEVKTKSGVKKGKLLRIYADNALVLDVPTGDLNDGMSYLVQIHAEYKVERDGIK